jgi:hypothetical protein
MAQLGQTLTNLQNYNDEINDPVISAVGHTGNYSDLIGAPQLAPVAYTGNYAPAAMRRFLSLDSFTG